VNQYLDRQAATSIEDAVTFIEKILAIIMEMRAVIGPIA
jgi:hypothetical protein